VIHLRSSPLAKALEICVFCDRGLRARRHGVDARSGAALAVERHDCPNCHAPADSACRTRGEKTAANRPRSVLVLTLREELDIPVPADRGPGRAWKQGPALAVVPVPRTERPVRIGYARTSTARQELGSGGVLGHPDDECEVEDARQQVRQLVRRGSSRLPSTNVFGCVRPVSSLRCAYPPRASGCGATRARSCGAQRASRKELSASWRPPRARPRRPA
jgi:hypothetical protein